MIRRVIVNADDFGWSEPVTSGILQGHLHGIVTSTTLMANLPGAAEALARAAREAPGLAIGLHLTLTEGRPLARESDVAAILDDAGNLRRSLSQLFLRVRHSSAVRRAVACEMEAQAARARDLGLRPSHLDGHKHVHLHPAILPEAIALARRHGIAAIRTTAEINPADLRCHLPDEWTAAHHWAQWLRTQVGRRWGRAAQQAVRSAGLATTDWFFGLRATGGISADLLRHLFQWAPEGTGELMVHPGLGEPHPDRPTRLGESRPKELAAVVDAAVREAAAARSWQFISFKEMTSEQ